MDACTAWVPRLDDSETRRKDAHAVEIFQKATRSGCAYLHWGRRQTGRTKFQMGRASDNETTDTMDTEPTSKRHKGRSAFAQ